MSPGKPPSSSQVLAALLGGDARGGASTRLGAIVLTVVALTLIILAVVVWPLIRLRAQPPQAVAAARPDTPELEQFAASFRNDLGQIEGRSLFAIPRPTAPRQEATKTRSPAPTRYGGPSVIAMINDQVWFSDGQRLGVGESGERDLKVIRLDAPWSAQVEWEGAEFTVSFFERSPLLSSTVIPVSFDMPPGSNGSSAISPPPRPAPAAQPDPSPRPQTTPASEPMPPEPEPQEPAPTAPPPPPDPVPPPNEPPGNDPPPNEPPSNDPPPPPPPPSEPESKRP